MLHHERGLDLEGNPYEIFDGQPPEAREAAKLASIVCVNERSRAQALGAIRRRLAGTMPDGPSAEELIARFEERHASVRPAFYSGAGLRLQNVDSAIAADVLAHFVARGVTCLPVHDSFIVPAQHEDELRSAMRDAYVARLGREPVIK